MSKCPHCGAEIQFSPKSKKVHCEYCGSDFNPKELKEETKKAKNQKTLDGRAFSCTQCGATLLTFDETAVTFCSYCGSQNMIEEKLIEQTAPDFIIPFSKTKEQCIANYKKKISSFLFCPSYMKSDIVINKFRGIYMPYGIYYFEHHGDCTNKGQKYNHRSGDYVYYDDYTIHADVDATYDGISYDLLSKFYDDYSGAIPFNYKEAEDFNPNYLPGFYADSKDVDIDTYLNDAKMNAINDSSRFFKKNSIYSKYSCAHPTVPFKLKDKKVGLFPVYFVSIIDKDKEHVHYAVINGQTGRVAADMPIDFIKYIAFSVFLAIPIFFLLNSFPVFLPVHINIFTIIMSIIAFIIYAFELDKTRKKDTHFNDKGFSKQIENNNKKNKYTIKGSYFLKLLISILLSISVIFMAPVEDYYYYGSATIGLILILWSFKDLISTYNLSVSRPIPQLEKRGGDENA